jgi:hypothetical protein
MPWSFLNRAQKSFCAALANGLRFTAIRERIGAICQSGMPEIGAGAAADRHSGRGTIGDQP